MYQRVTRAVPPFAVDGAIHATSTVLAMALGAVAFAAAADASSTHPAHVPGAERATCPTDVAPLASAIPGAAPYGAGANAPSLSLALTARAAGDDAVEYHVTARPARALLRDVTVTIRLTCVPGQVRLIGGPTASAGQVTAGPRALTWRLDSVTTPATAAFTIRTWPSARGGPLVGEVTATGPISNCPAWRAADTPVDADCRVTVQIPAAPAPSVSRARPISPPAAAHAPVAPTATPGATGTVASRTPATTPSADGALPVLPPAPGGSPSPSPSLLSQLDRPPVVPATAATPGAGTAEAVPATLRPDDTSKGDLSGRAFAFLIGGIAFLLLATAIVGSFIGAHLRRAGDESGDLGGWRLGDMLRGRFSRTESRHRTAPDALGNPHAPDRSREEESTRADLTHPDLRRGDPRTGGHPGPYTVKRPHTSVDVVWRVQAAESQPVHSGDAAPFRKLPAGRTEGDG